MPTFIGLFNFTDQGIRNVKETTKRYETAKAQGEKMGIKLVNFFYTLGPYDCVAIAEAKDEESLTAFMLASGAAGNVRTLSMRAFTVEEMKGLLAKL